MRKQLLSVVAGLFFISGVAAVLPQVDKESMTKAVRQEIKINPAEKMTQTAVSKVSQESVNPFKGEKASKYLAGNEFESFEMIDASKSGEEESVIGVALASDEPAIMLAPATRAGEAPALKAGTLISKEVNFRGARNSYRLTLEKSANADEWLLVNNGGRGDTVTMKVSNGVVTIEPQVIETNSTYGEIKILPMDYRDGKLYMISGNITGTVNDKGDITVSPYGIVCTQMDGPETPGKYYGSVFCMFTESSWCMPNVIVSATSVAENKLVMYESLFDQTSDNEMILYGFGNMVSSDVLVARLTTDKRIVVPTQLMYNNLMFGAFQNYAAAFSFDAASSKWKVSLDRKNPMEIVSDGQGGYKIGGWLVGAKAAPTTYTAYAYNDVNIETDYKIECPAPVPMNMTGSGKVADPYLVKSYKDLQSIAQATESGNSLAGVYFKLANDLSLESVSPASYVAIGNAACPFNGVFDGDGKTISNLIIDGLGFLNTGLFGSIGADGVVKNLNFNRCAVTSMGDNVGIVAGESAGTVSGVNITSSVVDCNGEIGGGVVGYLSAKSVVENCSFSGSLTTSGSIGGISGEAVEATIRNCHVKANITVDAYTSVNYNRQCGGILGTGMRNCVVTDCYVSGTITDKVGYAFTGGVCAYLSGSEVGRCFNTAPISAKRAVMGSQQNPDEGDVHTAGIVGYISDSRLHDCYNSGTIIKAEKSNNTGGVVGYLGVGYSTTGSSPTVMINVSDIQNCYNSGQILSTSVETHKGIYGSSFISTSYKGESPEEKCIRNCYYDTQIMGMNHDLYGKTTRELTSALPAGFDSSVWTSKTGSYPVLATGAGTVTQDLSAAPLTLRALDNSNKVKVEFDVAASRNVGWALSYDEEAGETATETAALKLNGNKVTVKDKYSVSVVQAMSSDNWGLKLYRLSIVPKVFDGEGIADDPYLIKTAEDFKKLNEAVGVYGQTHEGDYFAMANDIDFKGDASFMGVGTHTTGEFRGAFDGRNHSVKGMKIDAGTYDADGKAIANPNQPPYTGLFGIVGENGSVKNLTVAAENEFMFYQYGGPIAGLNNGLIENCRNYADINVISSYCGGVAGVNYDNGVITKCYNSGNIDYGVSNTGGITGYNRPGGRIEYCQNDGNVLNRAVNVAQVKTKQNTAGGVVGYNYGVVGNCVNNGMVRAFNTVGGIAGTSSAYNNQGNVDNCVNNALVTSLDDDLKRGGIIGYRQYDCKVSNNYYDASININGSVYNSGLEGCTGFSSSELVKGDALAGLDPQTFDFKVNAYPVLKLFAEEEASKAMRSIYVGFAPKTKRTNVLADTPLAKVDGLTFKLATADDPGAGTNIFSVNDGVLKVGKLQGNKVSRDSLTASLGEKYIKTYNIGAVPVILKGAGTAEEPYLIETPADWNLLADFMADSKWEYEGDVFSITNDLDFKGDSIRLIAVDGVNLQARLDGNNHTIKNYVYTNNNSIKTKLTGPNMYIGKYIGLVGTLGLSGELKNLVLDGSLQGNSYIGSAVGENYGKVENIVHKGKVETIGSNYVAGIVYRSHENSEIRNCVNEGTVLSKTTYSNGIVCETKAGSVLDNCSNKGTVKSTTTLAAGIAYKVAGEITKCVNEGKVLANSSVTGLVNTLANTAYMADCVNKSDLNLKEYCDENKLDWTKNGTNVVGLVSTLSALTVKDPESKAGKVVNCRNEGNLRGRSSVYGCFSAINAGWTIADCGNTGDVLSYLNDDKTPVTTSNYAAGFAYTIKSTKLELLTEIVRCFNTGRVVGSGGGIAGITTDASKFTNLRDCYNTGDVTNLSTSALTTAGLVGKHNGKMENCYNTGNVLSYGNAVGGLAGYIASGDGTYPAAIINSFNIGDVTSEYTGTSSTQGNAGGLVGYLSTATSNGVAHRIINSYNTGNVTANQRSGGLSAGAFDPASIVENCYNSGKVVCRKPDSNGRYWWSGTTFSNNYTKVVSGDTIFMLAGHSNCFYDKTVSVGGQYRNVPNSGKSTHDMCNLSLGDAYVYLQSGGYPVLKDFADSDAAHAGTAMILLADKKDEAHANVTADITLVGPAGAEWTVVDATNAGVETAQPSKVLTIKDGKAVPADSGDVVLTCNYKGMKKNFYLTVKYDPTSSVDESLATAEILSVEYVDLQGRRIEAPQPCEVVIVKTTYVDGTVTVVKKIAVK